MNREEAAVDIIGGSVTTDAKSYALHWDYGDRRK